MSRVPIDVTAIRGRAVLTRTPSGLRPYIRDAEVVWRNGRWLVRGRDEWHSYATGTPLVDWFAGTTADRTVIA